YVDLKKNLSLPKEEFVSNKLVLDKVRVDFNLAFESCMRPCRHLSTVYGLKTTSKDCLVKLAQHIGMQDIQTLEKFTEFYFKYRDLKDAVSPEELYDFLKENLVVFKNYAQAVVEHIKKTTGNYLLIDFDLLNEKAKHIKDSVKKIEFVLSQGIEEFREKPMYYDRVKYFYQVAYDSLFDICKHLAPKFGVKKFGDDCLSKLVEVGVIPQDYYMDIFKMTQLKNKLISTWEVSPDELYGALYELKDRFEPVMKEMAKSLKKLIEEKSKSVVK
ncbi:MAG: HepT-like ribonuclease domain-containing protein, partial [Hydrogenobacter sp.]